MASHRRSGDGGRAVWRHLAPVIRGIAIAVPLVLLLAALLVSADAVFAARLRDLVTTLPAVDEALGRLLLAVVAAYAVAGGLWHLLQRRDERILGDEAVPRVLGFTEASVVLVSVSALFAGFVGVQLRYFFGGATEVVAGGLTYAEYARRGFGELVVVAAVSLAVLLALAGLTRRQTSAQRWSFTALSATLTGLVLVILASAFQRLLLYEAAFGFTRLRTVVHVFMIWLGVLLVALLVLEFVERLRLFLLASICAVVGFAMTLNVVGIDALIVRHNLARAAAGAELDAAYLQQLSPDAVPALVAALPGLEPSLADDVAGILICLDTADTSDDWRSLRVADVRARAALGSVEPPAAGAVSIPCPP